MSHNLKIYSTSFAKFFALVLLVLFVSYFITVSQGDTKKVKADSSNILSGYAWSENIGWISLNSSNCDTNGNGFIDTSACGGTDTAASPVINYSVNVDQSGKLSGYAWSEYIGWISANEADLVACPKGSCTAKLLNNKLTGWLKALSGDLFPSDGWDGWISLSDNNPYDYGPTLAANGTFSGYAWGSDVVGWVDFSLARAPQTCVPVYACAGPQTIMSSCQALPYATCDASSFCSAGSSSCIPNTALIPGFTSFTAIGHDPYAPNDDDDKNKNKKKNKKNNNNKNNNSSSVTF